MALHILTLVYRTGLLALALLFPGWLNTAFGPASGLSLVNLIWVSYFICIVCKLIPVRHSLGRNKMMANYFSPTGATAQVRDRTRREQNRGALWVALVWVALNAVVYGLYFRGPLTASHMVRISLFYYVADLICILFFCPFQVFFMKNRCCVSCRIYSWDALMMVTPLIPLGTVFSWSLTAAALVVFIRWELGFARHPERFSHVTNGKLQCASCPEKSCRIKGQGGMALVRRFLPAGKGKTIED